MKIHRDQETVFYQYGDEYIYEFTKSNKKKDSWNETQLQLIVETMVNFIDLYTEVFAKQGYPGEPVWVFEQLSNLNTYVKTHDFKQDDPKLKEIEASLFKYIFFLKDCRNNKNCPEWFLKHNLVKIIEKPHQLVIGWFTKLGLEKLHASEFYFSPAQKQQAHEIIDQLLTTAVTTIKQSPQYEQAAAQGHLRYIEATLDQPASKLKDIKESKAKPAAILGSRGRPSALSISSSHSAGFFPSEPSAKETIDNKPKAEQMPRTVEVSPNSSSGCNFSKKDPSSNRVKSPPKSPL